MVIYLPSLYSINHGKCIQIDLFGPWTFTDYEDNVRHIKAVSIIDVATRWIELHEYSSKRSEDISLIIDREWFSRYPRPEYAIFDNGPEFSSEFQELLESYGVRPKPTTIKNPQANAIVERSHKKIANALRAMQLSEKMYDENSIHAILQHIAWGIRSTFHSTLRASPGQVVFDCDMIINATYVANWRYIKEQKETEASCRIMFVKTNAELLMIINLVTVYSFYQMILKENWIETKDHSKLLGSTLMEPLISVARRLSTKELIFVASIPSFNVSIREANAILTLACIFYESTFNVCDPAI